MITLSFWLHPSALERNNNHVSLLRYCLSGSQVGAPTTLASNLDFPTAITLSGGNLFVATNANSGTIAEYPTGLDCHGLFRSVSF